jgi:hypothetical protein
LANTYQQAINTVFINIKKTSLIACINLVEESKSMCNCICNKTCNIWGHLRPSIVSLIIPVSYVFLVFMFFGYQGEQWWEIFTLSIAIVLLLPLWFLFSYLLFPRIVVTIMNLNNIDDIDKFYLLADGKEIYKCEKVNPALLPIHFSFQVWQRGKYVLYLSIKKKESSKQQICEPQEANTYEHTICHVTFSQGKICNDEIMVSIDKEQCIQFIQQIPCLKKVSLKET